VVARVTLTVIRQNLSSNSLLTSINNFHPVSTSKSHVVGRKKFLSSGFFPTDHSSYSWNYHSIFVPDLSDGFGSKEVVKREAY